MKLTHKSDGQQENIQNLLVASYQENAEDTEYKAIGKVNKELTGDKTRKKKKKRKKSIYMIYAH